MSVNPKSVYAYFDFQDNSLTKNISLSINNFSIKYIGKEKKAYMPSTLLSSHTLSASTTLNITSIKYPKVVDICAL